MGTVTTLRAHRRGPDRDSRAIRPAPAHGAQPAGGAGLAVEVLSPSTRHIDLTLKRARLETAGCASYWVVDPDQPSLTAWDLVDGSYRQVADVSGSEGAKLTRPFPIRVVPSDLLDT